MPVLRFHFLVAFAAFVALLTFRPHDEKVMRLDEVVEPTAMTCTIPCDYGDSLARVVLWDSTIRWNNAARWNEAALENRRSEQRTEQRTQRTRTSSALTTTVGTGNCGGALPPCWIMMRESGGNIRAMNPSGAAGKWQIMPGTWNGYGGYASAADAPEAVQDAKARTMAPCNWQSPNYCGG